ncbi:hypothetical protein F5148DRAFT_1284689 [Russula earlei]|uniref:Uncharacterized protein n=1 Tax=Russula earlei TaxID=71964 RepID=A0ACC0U8B8_9AGAM|nr:hypothetical protein F5148DRAFT_1284689 [Russula earlei]
MRHHHARGPRPAPLPDLRPPRSLHVHPAPPRLRAAPKHLHLAPPPLNAPQSAIRAALARSRYDGRPATATASASACTSDDDGAVTLVLPPALERLLSRLASSDARTMLVRCAIYSHLIPPNVWLGFVELQCLNTLVSLSDPDPVLPCLASSVSLLTQSRSVYLLPTPQVRTPFIRSSLARARVK